VLAVRAHHYRGRRVVGEAFDLPAAEAAELLDAGKVALVEPGRVLVELAKRRQAARLARMHTN